MNRVLKAFEILLNPLKKKISSLVIKSILISINDSGTRQKAKIDTGLTVHEDVEIFSQFGFASNPIPENTKCLSICIDGNKENMLCILVTKPNSRPRLEKGEASFYNDYGKKIVAKEDYFQVNGGDKRLVTHGELNAALQSFISSLNAHTHICGAPGNPSAVPTVPMSLDISSSASEAFRTN